MNTFFLSLLLVMATLFLLDLNHLILLYLGLELQALVFICIGHLLSF